ncbi:MAG: cobalamin biosynthesis protein CobD [Desulfuromonadales bacterium]|nr:cobalamin biosynthesis protein CobD [Desulfuromonadales bacterium]
MQPTLLLIAVGLDLFFGDPRFLYHPVIFIGQMITTFEAQLRQRFNDLRLAGILLCLAVLLVTGGLTGGLLWLAGAVHPLLQAGVAVYLAFTTLALRQLHKESQIVVDLVAAGELDDARRALSSIVGRDTAHLNEEEILRACIETVAENSSDGVIAPLFYLCLGGPILAMLYKGVNTLDSMVGYKNDRFRDLGWASARLDDLLNLLPARLTGVLIVIVAFPLGLNGWSALKTMLRDARKPSSPNAGYPEAAAAGALDIGLGGPAIYFGRRMEKPTLGDSDRPITVDSYRRMVHLLYASSFLALLIGVSLLWMLRG